MEIYVYVCLSVYFTGNQIVNRKYRYFLIFNTAATTDKENFEKGGKI